MFGTCITCNEPSKTLSVVTDEGQPNEQRKGICVQCETNSNRQIEDEYRGTFQ